MFGVDDSSAVQQEQVHDRGRAKRGRSTGETSGLCTIFIIRKCFTLKMKVRVVEQEGKTFVVVPHSMANIKIHKRHYTCCASFNISDISTFPIFYVENLGQDCGVR